MKLKELIIIPSVVLLLAGCAGLNEKEKAEISQRFSDLNRSLDETRSRMEDLNNKVLLLNEKITELRPADRAASVPAAPPEGLKIVNLTEPEKKAEDPAQARAQEPPRISEQPVQAKSGLKKPAPEPEITEKGPEALYGAAQDLFIKGRYTEARRLFLDIVKGYPEHKLVTNALYWVGESYYTEKDFEKALVSFREIVDKHPDGPKAPDALLKVGLTYLETDNRDKGIRSLQALLKRYPDSEAAQAAKKMLQKR